MVFVPVCWSYLKTSCDRKSGGWLFVQFFSVWILYGLLLYMDGTAIFDLPTCGGPFNPYNVTQIHSIFVKLYENTFLDMPKVRAGSIFTFSMS